MLSTGCWQDGWVRLQSWNLSKAATMPASPHFGACSEYVQRKKKKHTPHKQHFSIFLFALSCSVPLRTAWTSGPAITAQCFAPLSYFTDNYRPQNRPNRSIPPPTVLLLQGVSRVRLFSYMPALLFQLSSHGRRLTSTRLLKTVSTDRHKERGVNTLTLEKPSHSLNNTLQMETHGCLLGRLIIGVVWLLAEASWLHFLTLISENRGPASSRRRAVSAGSLLSRPFTSFIMLDLYFTLISGFSASVASAL